MTITRNNRFNNFTFNEYLRFFSFSLLSSIYNIERSRKKISLLFFSADISRTSRRANSIYIAIDARTSDISPLVPCAGRGISEETTDYSLLVAFFAGGCTAISILIVGVTLTLYRRTHPTRTAKSQSAEPPTRYECNKEERSASSAPTSTNESQHRDDLKQQINPELPDDDPDVIPSKAVERRPDIFEPDFEASGSPSVRTRDFRCQEKELDYPSPSSVLHAKDSWIYPNGYTEKGLSPMRPSTLPVHRTHDIYTRSSRVQESCI